ncbi:MAG: hypothetical protein KDK96_02905 [Chlamydiia bacterium]|nr:hypothetical protein [Chlamydiia bacterium]
MEAYRPGLRREYEALSFEVNREAASGPIAEGTVLHQRVIGLFTEVAMNGDNLLARECGRLLNRFVIPMVMPDRIDRPEEVRTLYGVGSQYSDGSNSSCTSCAQAFLRNVLPLGIAWDLTTEQITSFVDMGKGLYFALIKQAEMIREQDRGNLGESFILHQAFSAHEISGQYGLHFMGAHPERFLDIELATGSLVPFFMRQLTQLEEQLSPLRKSIGATIHCQEKTYALAILDTERGREFVFFDSHGNPELNGGNPNAYVKYTFNREAMARALAQVMPFHPVGELEQQQVRQSHEEGLLGGQDPLDVIARMNRENNPYILYQMDVAERGILAEVSYEGPRLDERVTSTPTGESHHHREAEKTNNLSKMLFVVIAAILIAFRKRLMSIITSYTGKNGQALLPPPSTLRSIEVK